MDFPKTIFDHSRETIKDRKCGDTVWACAFEFNSKKSSLGLAQEPVEGILAYTNSESAEQRYADKSNYEAFSPRYFIPKSKKDGYAWSKAVHVESRAYADDYVQCASLYEIMVINWINWFKEGVALCKQYI